MDMDTPVQEKDEKKARKFWNDRGKTTGCWYYCYVCALEYVCILYWICLHFSLFVLIGCIQWTSVPQLLCLRGFPGGSAVKNLPAIQETQGHKFNPWVREDPLSRKWQPTPIFLPGKSHGQRSLTGYSPWGHKELDMTAWLKITILCLRNCLINYGSLWFNKPISSTEGGHCYFNMNHIVHFLDPTVKIWETSPFISSSIQNYDLELLSAWLIHCCFSGL